MVSLFDDPRQIIRVDKVDEFWPTKDQTSAQRVNATARFVVYATCILYLIRRDIRVFILGATVLGVLFVMEKSHMIKGSAAKKRASTVSETYMGACQGPTVDNPMANVLMSDYDGRPDRPSACRYDTVRSEVNQRLSGRIPYGAQKSRSPLPDAQRNAFDMQFEPESIDLLLCDFGVGSRMKDFAISAWKAIKPGGFLVCHSTLTNTRTRSWLEKIRNRCSEEETGIPDGEFVEISLLEPHKRYQNSVTILQRRKGSIEFEEPIYSEYA